MDAYSSLLDIATLLLAADDAERAGHAVFHRLAELSGAERGYIVVRESGDIEVKRDLHFDRDAVTAEERRVSRRLVRQVLATRAPFVSGDILADARIEPIESLERAGRRAVLVVPLVAADDVYGVIYLDRRSEGGGFSDAAVKLVSDVAGLAGQVLRRAIEHEEVRRRMKALERDLFAQHDFQGIVTRDERMVAALRTVAQVAPSDATVLIAGETGTGKELVARAIHANSKRARGPFVAIHCGALPPTLLESELFGHRRGAFTGALRERAGRIAAADGGTLFLDEVAEIPVDVQATLLRFLQSGEIQRLGTDRVEKVDVRIVAATHRPLRAMVDAGTFRQDLYYRLNVVQIAIPPLRDRRRDIPLLADTFLRAKGGEPPRFSPRAMELLVAHDYPGNVRELLHLVERARVLAAGPELGVDVLPPELVPVPEPPPGEEEDPRDVPTSLARARASAVETAERAFLADLLERARGNISAASRLSGIHRSYLQRLLTRHGLRAG